MLLLAKENLVHTNLVAGNERYFFAYDQMNDYFFARSLFSHAMSDMSIRKTLYEDILQVNDDNIVNLSNSDVFVICCAIYAQKFGKECIDLIDELPEGFEKDCIVKLYIDYYNNRRYQHRLFIQTPMQAHVSAMNRAA